MSNEETNLPPRKEENPIADYAMLCKKTKKIDRKKMKL